MEVSKAWTEGNVYMFGIFNETVKTMLSRGTCIALAFWRFSIPSMDAIARTVIRILPRRNQIQLFTIQPFYPERTSP